MAGFFDEEDIVKKPAVAPQKVAAPQAGSSFFDSEDVVAPSAIPAQQQAAQPAQSFFDDEDVVQPGSSPEKVLDPNRSFWDRPAILSQEVTDKELATIASKYNVDPAKLREALPLLGGMPEKIQPADIPKGIGGFLGEAITLGAPQKIYRMNQDPATERALDELKDVVGQRKSYLQGVGEMLAPGGALIKVGGKGLKAAVGTGALQGAVAGFGGSEQGEILPSVGKGAALGVGAGLAGYALPRALSKINQVRKELKLSPVQNVPTNLTQLEQRATQELSAAENKAIEHTTMLPKGVQQANPEIVERVLNAEYSPNELTSILKGDSAEQILKKAPQELQGATPEQTIKNVLAQEIVNREKKDFIHFKTGETVNNPQEIEKRWNQFLGVGDKELRNQLNEFRATKKIQQYIEEEGLKDLRPMGKIEEGTNKLLDARFVLRKFDEKFKTNLEPLLDDVSARLNTMKNVLDNSKRQNDLIRASIKDDATLKAATQGKIVDALESGQLGELTPAEKTILDNFRNQYDRFHAQITNEKATGDFNKYNFKKVEEYLPRMTVPVPETISRLGIQMERAANEINAALGTNYKDLASVPQSKMIEAVSKSPALQNLQRYINWVTGAEVPVGSGGRMVNTIMESIQNNATHGKLDRMARGTMQRTADAQAIPGFLREKNLFKMWDRYTQDMMSDLYLRNPLSKMRNVSARIRAAGGRAEAEYIDKMIADQMGTRPGTVNAFMKEVKAQLSRSLDPKIEKALAEGKENRAFVYNTLKEMGQFPAFLAKQIYPNVLGWRIAPILQNLSSGLARTAPELGGTYGMSAYLRGVAYGLKNWTKGSQELISKGYIPTEYSRVGQRAIAEGLRNSKAVDAGVKGLDALSELGMSVYAKSEHINRLSLLGTSKMMAHDLLASTPAAQKAALGSLRKFPTSVQRAVAAAGTDQEKVADIIMKHLNGSTAFNYNKFGQSEFGRTMGPMFATFAKWPTSIAGELASDIKTKGALRGGIRAAERYAIPLIAFGVLDWALKNSGQSEDELTQKIVGKGGVTKAAPVSSLTGFIVGDIFTPPAIDVLMQSVIKPTVKMEPLQMAKGASKAAGTYAPGAGFIRFLTEDLPVFSEAAEKITK